MVRSFFFGWAGLVFVAMLLVTACGRKTMVVPPDTHAPEPIADLAYSFTENGVDLHWSYPLKTVAGNDVDRLRNFELWRAEIPLEKMCTGCPKSFKKRAKIKADPPPGPGTNRRVHFEDTTVRHGYYYLYKVRPSTGWLGDGGDSNIVEFARQ